MWCIEYAPETRLLALRLTRQVSTANMRAIMRVHAQALAATGGDGFKVLLDLRGLAPLESEAAALFSDVKRAAQAMPGFESRVVLCDSATIAMQQRRTSIEDGTAELEIITFDESDARKHLGIAPADR